MTLGYVSLVPIRRFLHFGPGGKTYIAATLYTPRYGQEFWYLPVGWEIV